MARPRNKLNPMFIPTEPKQLPTGDDTPNTEPEKKKLKPQSVYLTQAELAYIQEIADTYGESRHSVLQFAVKELIREWKKKGQLRTNILGKLDK